MDELIIYGSGKLVYGEDHLGWYCYLSPTYVMKPWHCCDPSDDIIFKREMEDIAIVRVKIAKTGLAPCCIKGARCSTSYKLTNGSTIEKEETINEYLTKFTVDKPVELGDSGTIVYYEGGVHYRFDGKQGLNAQVPLFMIVARSWANSRIVLAVNLLHMLKFIRDFDVAEENRARGSTKSLPAAPARIDTEVWELVRNEIRKGIAEEANRLSRPEQLEHFKTLAEAKSFDADFIAKVVDFMDKSVDADTQYLYNALAVAEAVGFDHKCWIASIERQKSSDNRRPLFRIVFDHITKFDMHNIVNITGPAGRDEEVSLYAGSSHPIIVASRLYEVWKVRGIDENSVCHHPFLCEGGDHCRGVVMRASKSSASSTKASEELGAEVPTSKEGGDHSSKEMARPGEDSSATSAASSTKRKRKGAASELRAVLTVDHGTGSGDMLRRAQDTNAKSTSIASSTTETTQRAASAVEESAADASKKVSVSQIPYLSHCCFRPSHLVKLNNGFNSFCTGTLQALGRAHSGEVSVNVSVRWDIPAIGNVAAGTND